jgi:tetratricopeptide (TPR) repeat protein
VTVTPSSLQVPALAGALRRHEAGDLGGARLGYIELLDQPDLTPLCVHQLAVIAANKGEHGRAAALFQRAIQMDGRLWIAYHNLSAAVGQLGDPVAALGVLIDLGCALHATGQRDDAEQIYARVVEREPNHYAGLVNLGTCLAHRGQQDQALPHLLRAVQLCGRVIPMLASCLRALEGQGLPLADLPDDAQPVGFVDKVEEALTTLGKLLGEMGHADAGLACHRQAIDLRPGFALGHWNFALAALEQGDFATGWREYEWRWSWDGFPAPRLQHPAPTWRGEALAGKRILVWCEQGFGDAIQFSPLATWLTGTAGAEVSLAAPRPLVRLFQASFSGITVVDQKGPLPEADFTIPLMSLPDRFGLTPADLPLDQRYLCPPDAAAAAWEERMAGTGRGPRIGLVWAGRPEYSNDSKRSLPLPEAQRLAASLGGNGFSLQLGPRKSEAATLGLTDLTPHLIDFAETAAAVARLDLVVAVDTAVAHLAAALGKPTRLLLPCVADWRWQDHHDETPWYPSMQIYRQRTIGDWDEVLGRLEAELSRA